MSNGKEKNGRRERLEQVRERKEQEDKGIDHFHKVIRDYHDVDHETKGDTTRFRAENDVYDLLQPADPTVDKRRKMFAGESGRSTLPAEAIVLCMPQDLDIFETSTVFDIFDKYKLNPNGYNGSDQLYLKAAEIVGQISERIQKDKEKIQVKIQPRINPNTGETISDEREARIEDLTQQWLLDDLVNESEDISVEDLFNDLHEIFYVMVICADDYLTKETTSDKIHTTGYGKQIDITTLFEKPYQSERLNKLAKAWKHGFNVPCNLEEFIGMAIKLPNNKPFERAPPKEQRGENLAIGRKNSDHGYPTLNNLRYAYNLLIPIGATPKKLDGAISEEEEQGLYRLQLTRCGYKNSSRTFIDHEDGKLWDQGIVVTRSEAGIYFVDEINDDTGTFQEGHRSILIDTELMAALNFKGVANMQDNKTKLETLDRLSDKARSILAKYSVDEKTCDAWYTNPQNKNKIVVTTKHAVMEYDILAGRIQKQDGTINRDGLLGKLYVYVSVDTPKGHEGLRHNIVGVAVQPNTIEDDRRTRYHQDILQKKIEERKEHVNFVKELFCRYLMRQYDASVYLANMFESNVVDAHRFDIR